MATTAIRIADFDDPDFDPFAAIDQIQGFDDVVDPYPQFRAMLEQGTVQKGDLRVAFGMPTFPIWDKFPSYLVFGYEATSAAFSDAPSFSNSVMKLFYDDSFGESIDGMDGAEHMRYRRYFQKAFLPQNVARWGKELVPGVMSSLIDDFAHEGKAELVGAFTSLFPFYVIYGQLRMPLEERFVFQKLAVGLTIAGTDPTHSREAHNKMGEYFSALLEERRRSQTDAAPDYDGEDLVTTLATAEIDGERLPNEIAVSFLRQLMAAAGDTTYRVAGSLLAGLLTHPEQLEAVRSDRSLVPKAVEEALRWEPPILVQNRLTTRDVTIDGVNIPGGSKVDIILGTANRDPAKFSNPDAFDIFRKPERHFAFAYGAHVCIGQHLARLELHHALNALLDRLPNLRLDPDYPAPRVLGLNSRSPVELRVLFD